MGLFVNFLAGPGLYALPAHLVYAIMLNYVDNCASPNKMNRIRWILQVARPKYTSLDSGGYQRLTAELNGKGIKEVETITPEKVVEAAAQLKPTFMMALDAPIRDLKGDEEREQEFKNKLEKNVLWAIETAALRQERCPDVGLFIPVQCYSLQHLNEFMRAIEGIKLTGLSLPIRGMSLRDIALFLLRFHQLGIKSVHLLGIAAFFPMALAAYFSRHFFQWVSLDAKTWMDRALHNDFLSPYDLTSV